MSAYENGPGETLVFRQDQPRWSVVGFALTCLLLLAVLFSIMLETDEIAAALDGVSQLNPLPL